jgi:hypothetical protein
VFKRIERLETAAGLKVGNEMEIGQRIERLEKVTTKPNKNEG